MKIQANLKYSKKTLIINNIKWLAISKNNNAIYVGEHESKDAYKISLDDILALSIYDLKKGGKE